jgi:large subunit ribosomal protein L9
MDKKKISVEEPIKRLGSYTVNVKVHPEITAQLNITVIAE